LGWSIATLLAELQTPSNLGRQYSDETNLNGSDCGS
jgi:hypothetical protein